MTYEQFCYWLQGYFELSDEPKLSSKQIETIETHLGKVFNKDEVKQITPFITGLKPVDEVQLGDPTPVIMM